MPSRPLPSPAPALRAGSRAAHVPETAAWIAKTRATSMRARPTRQESRPPTKASPAGLVCAAGPTGRGRVQERRRGVAAVTFDRISKVYPDGTRAVSDLEFEAQDGEFMVLVGPSGCGKTTALRMVAGIEEFNAGVLRIGDRVVTHVPSRDR